MLPSGCSALHGVNPNLKNGNWCSRGIVSKGFEKHMHRLGLNTRFEVIPKTVLLHVS